MPDLDPIARPRSSASPDSPETDDEALPGAEIGSEPSTALREGLPPTFRMRHDAHYVDQIEALAAQPVRLLSITEIEAPPCAARSSVSSSGRSVSWVWSSR